MSIRDWSWFTFWRTLPTSSKGGKAYTNLRAQDIWKTFLPWVKGSIFQDMYWGNWCDTLEVNRSICGVSLIWHNFPNMVELVSSHWNPLFAGFSTMQMWTNIASLSFIMKDTISNLAALSFKTFMWDFRSFTDQRPLQASKTCSPAL